MDLNQLIKAIQDAGPNPEIHYRIMEKHRHEWPELWKAIDTLIQNEQGG